MSEISSFEANDIPLLPALYKACFGIEVKEEFFHWKYFCNPSGEVCASKAMHKGRITAFYGLLPEIFQRGPRKWLVHQSMDTMTHPDFQRKGLFIATAQATYAEALRKHESLNLYGIPGTRSLPGFLKLGWTQAPSLRLLFQHSAALALGAPKHIDLKEANHDWASYFRDRGAPEERTERHHSLAQFQWLVQKNPLYRFELLALRDAPLSGYISYRKMAAGKILVQQIDAQKPENRARIAPLLLRALAARHPKSWIYIWEPHELSLKSALRKAWMLANPLPFGPFSHKVPLILHSMGKDPASWSSWEPVDWQAIYQD